MKQTTNSESTRQQKQAAKKAAVSKTSKIPAESLSPFVSQYYPQYAIPQRYPADQCARIWRAKDEWGIFCNFHRADIEIGGMHFDSTERLYHLMKFVPTAEEGIRSEYAQRHGMGVKMHMKPMYKANPDWFRGNWGEIGLDVMKFCLQQKYEQCPEFRAELERSKGLYIVEDETNRAKGRRPASMWSTVEQDGFMVGPNLLGRLLMELRDNGRLDYQLPADAFDFIEVLKKAA